MNRGFPFILAFPIFFLCILWLTLAKYAYQEQEKFDEYVLKFAIDYSTDAATEELLNMAHVGTDYIDLSRMNTDPEVALNTFVRVLCYNYDLPQTDKAHQMIRSNYMPVFYVVTYNGYYVYELKEDTEHGWDLQGSIKYPFSYYKNGYYYSLNLGLQNCRKLEDGNLILKTLEAENMTAGEANRRINTLVSDEMMFSFQRTTNRTSQFINVPTELTTFSRVNPIKGPTVMAFLDGWDMSTLHPVSAFSIGGARIQISRQVACYEREITHIDGTKEIRKFYAYADLLPAGAHILDLFPSVELAARAGYQYDHLYM